MDKLFITITPESVKESFRRILEADPLLPLKLGGTMTIEQLKKLIEEAQTKAQLKEIVESINPDKGCALKDGDWAHLTYLLGKRNGEIEDQYTISTMTHKGFAARVEYSDEDGCFIGHIAGILDVVGFHGGSVAELKAAFEEAVENYLEICREHGVEPTKIDDM